MAERGERDDNKTQPKTPTHRASYATLHPLLRLPASVHFVQNDRRAHERTLLTRGSNDNPVEQTEDGRGKQTDQRPDHPLENVNPGILGPNPRPAVESIS